MPSVKIPRKSTATDMTPFVDVAFLILSFFMLATKFKPPEPAQITTPRSVSADELKESNSLMVQFDSTGRVFFDLNAKKDEDAKKLRMAVIQEINKQRSLGLTATEMNQFVKSAQVGVPFTELKRILQVPAENRLQYKQPGIPVDTANNELAQWLSISKAIYRDNNMDEVSYMIKGDNLAKYPKFNGVLDAFRKSDTYGLKLVTDPKAVPENTALYTIRGSKPAAGAGGEK